MAHIQTEIVHHISLSDFEQFKVALPTGMTKVDNVKVRRFGGRPASIEVGGFLVKKDGEVGTARRIGDIALRELPEVLATVVEPLLTSPAG